MSPRSHQSPSALLKELDEQSRAFRVSLQGNAEWEDKAHVILAEHGWYVHAEMIVGEMFSMLALGRNNQTAALHHAMIEAYSRDLPRLRERLCSKHGERSHVLVEAFEAHRLAMYHASTVLFLTQVDGICEGTLMRGKRPSYLRKKQSPSVANAVLDRTSPSFERNRHSILHGMDLDFGTESRSLQALSLLCFVSDTVGRFDRRRL